MSVDSPRAPGNSVAGQPDQGSPDFPATLPIDPAVTAENPAKAVDPKPDSTAPWPPLEIPGNPEANAAAPPSDSPDDPDHAVDDPDGEDWDAPNYGTVSMRERMAKILTGHLDGLFAVEYLPGDALSNRSRDGRVIPAKETEGMLFAVNGSWRMWELLDQMQLNILDGDIRDQLCLKLQLVIGKLNRILTNLFDDEDTYFGPPFKPEFKLYPGNPPAAKKFELIRRFESLQEGLQAVVRHLEKVPGELLTTDGAA